MDNEKGRWITTKTKKHVFIPEGRDVGEVLKETFSQYEDEEKFDKEEVSLEANDIVYEFQTRSFNMTVEQKEYLVDLIEKMPDDCKKILFKLKDKNFKFIVTEPGGTNEYGEREKSSYNRGSRRCCVEKQFLEKFDGDDSYYFNGQVECHEIGHMVDNLLNDDKWEYMSSTYKSKLDGKTLHETILQERRKFSESIISNIAYETVREFEERELESLGKDKIEKWRAVNEMQAKELGVDSNEYEFYKSYYEEIDNRRNEKFREKYPDDDYFKFRKEIYRTQRIGRRKFIHEYNVLSDIASSKWFKTMGYGSKNNGFGLGHTEYYYQQRSNYGLGAEFFANCFAARCTNHDEIIKTTEKYFPQSVAVFKEIMEEMAK